MHKYTLSSRADNDLDDITDYTLEIWGENQTRDYITGFYNYKAHTIFYEPTEKGIFVVRILGQRQDFERHL